ncbi:granulocyte colony-stimulating factor receptor [Engystomops pustulosus]|uniref:granulocyte colony-stimulating factor receptor n=1 Tax=Engystomops pustulosus TaxID=76066 RepID=UPI003AFA40B2
MKKKQGLLWMLLILFVVEGVHSCRITVASSVIQFGSPLSASCDCPHLRSSKSVVVWKLDKDFVPCNQTSDVQMSTCPLYFPNFNKTTGVLQCYVRRNDVLQLVDQTNIKAGYPPSPATNISCLMFISQNIVNCTWQLQRDSLLEENVTLSAFRSKDECETPSSAEYICNPPKGIHFCIIQRKYFNNFDDLAVRVTVQNKIGSAPSSLLCLKPLFEVKVDPIIIDDAVPHNDCVRLQWTYGKKANFLTAMRCQLHYKMATEIEWTKPIEIPVDVKTADQCGLLAATKYDFQVRCIRKFLTGQWSEWGPTRSMITAELAPAEKLESWWRTLESTQNGSLKIQLMWKKLEKNKANADHVWYIVKSSSDLHETNNILCNTTNLNCTIVLHKAMKSVFIWTCNNAGVSPVKEITFPARIGTPVSKMLVSSNNDTSLQVMWDPPSSAEGYLLEWYKRTELPDCEMNWKTEQKGSMSSILQDIEPFQRYSVRLYPLYQDCIGMARETDAYSKEGAPDYSPEIRLLTVSKSQAVVQWDPIPVQKSNGFITNYTVFWTDTSGKENSSTVNGSTATYNITDLIPSTTYQVFLMSSSSGGSVNGTALMLHTANLDNEDINMLLLIFLLFGLFIIVSMITCILKHDRVKSRFWPVVPDPANSQMGKLTAFLKETPKMTFKTCDISQIITSELNIMEGCQMKNAPLGNKINDTLFDDYGHAYNKQISPEEDPNKSRYYVNVDTVQYAKVITGGYREQSPPTSVYVRSDSTQPLICDVSPSPQNYENTWFHFNNHEDSVFMVEGENMQDFPLLNALQLHQD